MDSKFLPSSLVLGNVQYPIPDKILYKDHLMNWSLRVEHLQHTVTLYTLLYVSATQHIKTLSMCSNMAVYKQNIMSLQTGSSLCLEWNVSVWELLTIYSLSSVAQQDSKPFWIKLKWFFYICSKQDLLVKHSVTFIFYQFTSIHKFS